MSQQVHKVVLSSGKEVLLKEMKIKYQNLALKAVGNKAGENKALLASMMGQELLKILIFQIDGVAPGPKELENLDDIFSFQDFQEITGVIGKIMGGDEMGELQTEIVNIGG